MALKASREIIDLMEAQSEEINRLRDGMKRLAEGLGCGHLECRDKIMALINPPIKTPHDVCAYCSDSNCFGECREAVHE